jgi:hypothetical protein
MEWWVASGEKVAQVTGFCEIVNVTDRVPVIRRLSVFQNAPSWIQKYLNRYPTFFLQRQRLNSVFHPMKVREFRHAPLFFRESHKLSQFLLLKVDKFLCLLIVLVSQHIQQKQYRHFWAGIFSWGYKLIMAHIKFPKTKSTLIKLIHFYTPFSNQCHP